MLHTAPLCILLCVHSVCTLTRVHPPLSCALLRCARALVRCVCRVAGCHLSGRQPLLPRPHERVPHILHLQRTDSDRGNRLTDECGGCTGIRITCLVPLIFLSCCPFSLAALSLSCPFLPSCPSSHLPFSHPSHLLHIPTPPQCYPPTRYTFVDCHTRARGSSRGGYIPHAPLTRLHHQRLQ